MSGAQVSTMQEGGDHRNSSRVLVMDHDLLVLVTVVLDNALDQDINRSAQEHIVCGIMNDVELHI